jgi:hypothetical protein
MTGRIPCIVPHCRHMVKRHHGETEAICAVHWRAIPTRYRRVYARAYHWAEGDRYRRKGPPVGRHLLGACDRLWRRMKCLAIEAAAGIR